MKRLLLSTTLMLGTLTGVKAADLTPASAETIQRSITEVGTRVNQLSAKIADLPAQIDLNTQVARALSPISADVAKLGEELETLTSKIDAIDRTLQQLAPPTPAVVDTLATARSEDAFNAARQSALSELDRATQDYSTIQTYQTTLRSSTPTNDMLFFNTQKTIDIFLSDIIRQATFSWPRFETAMVVLCFLSHLYVHWISDDPTKISSFDKSRIAVPITSALTVKALDSARKIWNDYHATSTRRLQDWKARLQDPHKRYHASFLLACTFIRKNHTSASLIKVKLQEIFLTAHNFSSIDKMLP